MIQKIAIPFFLLIVAGLLIWQRFDVESQLPMVVTAEDGSEAFRPGDHLKRGQLIETGPAERIALSHKESFIALDENTQLELVSLTEADTTIKITKGRMVVEAPRNDSVFVETNYVTSVVQASIVTFINYDFLETVQIIPLDGTVQYHVKDTPDYYMSPVAISIKETAPIEYNKIEFNRNAAPAAVFYDWVDNVHANP